MGRDQALTQVDGFIALNCTFKTEYLAGLSGWLTSGSICNGDSAIARRDEQAEASRLAAVPGESSMERTQRGIYALG